MKEKCLYCLDTGCSHCAPEDTTVSESPSVTGYVADLERACFDIYMDIHVSEIKPFPSSIKLAWSMGQEIWIKRQARKET